MTVERTSVRHNRYKRSPSINTHKPGHQKK